MKFAARSIGVTRGAKSLQDGTRRSRDACDDVATSVSEWLEVGRDRWTRRSWLENEGEGTPPTSLFNRTPAYREDRAIVER